MAIFEDIKTQIGWKDDRMFQKKTEHRISTGQSVVPFDLMNGKVDASSVIVSHNGIRLLQGKDFDVRDTGIVLRKHMIGPSDLIMEYTVSQSGGVLAPGSILELVLLPRQVGMHIFTQEALEGMRDESIGKDFKVKILMDYNQEFNGITSDTCRVVKAWVDEKGLCGRIIMG